MTRINRIKKLLETGYDNEHEMIARIRNELTRNYSAELITKLGAVYADSDGEKIQAIAAEALDKIDAAVMQPSGRFMNIKCVPDCEFITEDEEKILTVLDNMGNGLAVDVLKKEAGIGNAFQYTLQLLADKRILYVEDGVNYRDLQNRLCYMSRGDSSFLTYCADRKIKFQIIKVALSNNFGCNYGYFYLTELDMMFHGAHDVNPYVFPLPPSELNPAQVDKWIDKFKKVKKQ